MPEPADGKRGVDGQREAQHGEIANRYAHDRSERAKRQGKRSFSLLALWAKDAREIMRRRHGVVMEDTKLVRWDFQFLALLMARLDHGKRQFENFVGVNAAWLTDPERDDMWASAIADPRRLTLTAAKISRHFELEWKERGAFGVRNLPAADVKGEDLRKLKAERRRGLDRLRKRRERAKHGAVSRAEYLAGSLSKIKPWEAEGVTRATWYRRRRRTRSEPT
jgi:hypothetical protein